MQGRVLTMWVIYAEEYLVMEFSRLLIREILFVYFKLPVVSDSLSPPMRVW